MDGGELLATGSSSCVFTPNLPCKKTGKIDSSRISKIVYSPEAVIESKDEKRMNDKIKKIKDYSKWALIFDEYCKPMSKEILKTYDPGGIEKCFNDEEELYLIEDFDKNSYMMNGKMGGITLLDYFEDIFYSKKTLNKTFTKSFYTLMEKIEPLFLGLKVMNDKKIVHNDIKYNNIVLHEGVFKYIDFGLSELSTKKQRFKDRSLDELNTSRIYLFYPVEYLLFYGGKNRILKEVEQLTITPRRNIYELDQILRLFSLDIINVYNIVSYNLINKKITEKSMIENIDVYSLGILVPLMFLTSTKFYNEKSPSEAFIKKILSKNNMVQEFFTLFGMMINPSSKERIKPEYAYKEFKRLLKKFKNKENLSKKKSIKKTISRKKISRKKISKKNIRNNRRNNITPYHLLRENKRRLT